jgi:hypothetical protein
MLEEKDLMGYVSKITSQWLAGFFDGEGCVCIRTSQSSGSFSLVVKLTQKDIKILSLVLLKFPDGNFDFSDTPTICWNGVFAKDILLYIKEDVIIKRKQVAIALEFISLLNPKEGTQRLKDGNIERRKELFILAKEEKLG